MACRCHKAISSVIHKTLGRQDGSELFATTSLATATMTLEARSTRAIVPDNGSLGVKSRPASIRVGIEEDSQDNDS